jgi:ABC-type protease/lipase transport system fused ATPase/permease subunit
VDIVGDIFEFIFDLTGARIGCAISALLSGAVAIATTMWHSSLSTSVHACNNMGGIGQFVTGTTSNCAIDKPLVWIVLAICVLAWIAAVGFAGGLVYLLLNPDKFPKED